MSPIEHQHGIARILCIIGGVSYGQGDLLLAVAQYCRSFAICHQLHDTAGCADVFEALAPILAELGRSDLLLRAIGAAAALRGTDGTHLTPAEQATARCTAAPVRGAAWRADLRAALAGGPQRLERPAPGADRAGAAAERQRSEAGPKTYNVTGTNSAEHSFSPSY